MRQLACEAAERPRPASIPLRSLQGWGFEKWDGRLVRNIKQRTWCITLSADRNTTWIICGDITQCTLAIPLFSFSHGLADVGKRSRCLIRGYSFPQFCGKRRHRWRCLSLLFLSENSCVGKATIRIHLSAAGELICSHSSSPLKCLISVFLRRKMKRWKMFSSTLNTNVKDNLFCYASSVWDVQKMNACGDLFHRLAPNLYKIWTRLNI